MFGSLKLYIILAAITALVGLAWGLKSSIEENAIKDMQIEALVQGTAALEELHEKEKKIAIFDTKAKLKKEEIEKTFIRSNDASQDSLDDNDIYFSL